MPSKLGRTSRGNRNGRRYTDRQIAKALMEGGGILNRAADALGCKRETISKRIDASEALKKIIVEARDQVGDIAEDTLRKAIELENILFGNALEAAKNGGALIDVPKLSATLFANKTLNRSRGYGSYAELAAPGGGPLIPGAFVVERPAATTTSFDDWAEEFKPRDEEEGVGSNGSKPH